MTVDPRAATGFAAAEAYERGRPGYPEAAVARLAGELGVTAASTVLDLAAGTGKLTRLLVPRAGRVLAVEPAAEMRTALRTRLPGVTALNGAAEAIPLADAAVDAVFVGEAFHWFRTEEAYREIARVLRAGGGLALLWNRERWSEDDLPCLPAFRSLVAPHREAAGPFPAGEDRWRRAFERGDRFAPLADAEVDHVHRLDPDGFAALVASWSWIANLPEARRDALVADVRRLVGDRRQLALRYRTEIHWTRLRTYVR